VGISCFYSPPALRGTGSAVFRQSLFSVAKPLPNNGKNARSPDSHRNNRRNRPVPVATLSNGALRQAKKFDAAANPSRAGFDFWTYC